MSDLVHVLIEQLAIWAPSLTAVLGIVVTVISSLNKARESWNELKQSTDFKSLKKELEDALHQNEELIRVNKLLLDEITKIKDYADHKKGEKK